MNGRPVRQDLAGSGSWCYWIAGLSLVNVVLQLTNVDFGFAASLNLAEIAAWLGSRNELLRIPAFGFVFLILGFFFFMGYQAVRGARWAFLTAGIIVVLDCFWYLFAGISGIIGLLIHALAAWQLFAGYVKAGEEEVKPQYFANDLNYPSYERRDSNVDSDRENH